MSRRTYPAQRAHRASAAEAVVFVQSDEDPAFLHRALRNCPTSGEQIQIGHRITSDQHAACANDNGGHR